MKMHVPVMPEETIRGLSPRPGGVYIDGTLGSGGHARKILERAGEDGVLLGIDRDASALERASATLKDAPGRKILVRGRHGDIAAIAAANGISEVDGILIDCGVSSDQIDTPERGFSFMADGPLDMRMDAASGESAADFIASRTVAEIERVLREYGEEPRARAIALAIAAARDKAPILTTGRLAGIVEKAAGRHGPHHPATRTFQAIRMAVNAELDELARALRDGLALLRPGGRFAVITFESLSDRLVKRFFAAHCIRRRSLPQGGEAIECEPPPVALANKKAICAGAAETAANPRSRSAKLRVAERLPDAAA